MTKLEKCPICGGDTVRKEVEKVLRGGGDTVVVTVPADVCLKCGERMYDQDVVQSFEELRSKLRRGEFEHLKSVGTTFTVDDDWANTAVRPAKKVV